ncbi:MAG: class B sortase [Bacillota bacterium]
MNRRTNRRRAAALLTALILFLAADAALFIIAGMPRAADAAEQKKWEGLDLIAKYRENPDMAGWLQVDGTNINYPVMRGDAYLYRNFRGDQSDSGSLFVEDDWDCGDLCTLIYGHNMWMYGTMFNPLHSFAEEEFFQKNRTIRFYAITDGGESAEKRTYEIICCVRTRVDEWNYASCRYICSEEDLAAFASECRSRAVLKRERGGRGPDGRRELIVLSTCSYHVSGDTGRLLVVGELTDRTEQTKIH